MTIHLGLFLILGFQEKKHCYSLLVDQLTVKHILRGAKRVAREARNECAGSAPQVSTTETYGHNFPEGVGGVPAPG